MTSGVSSLDVCREGAFARKDAQQSQVQPLPSKSFRMYIWIWCFNTTTQPCHPSNKSCCPPAPRTKIDQCCPFPSAHGVAGVATCVTTFLGFACLECTGQPHLLQRLGQKVETGIFVMVSRYLYTILYINAKGNYVPCSKQKIWTCTTSRTTKRANIHL